MVSGLFTYTLPVLQLVCHLVTTENSSTDGTISEAIIPLLNLRDAESSSHIGTTPAPTRTLPPDYVAHPDFGVAYKVHNESATWYVANARCVQEGAHLGIIDSFAKFELVKQQQPAKNENLYVGFQMIDGNNSAWYSAKTGLPVENLPWKQGEPNGGGLCAATYSSQVGLGRWPCTNSWRYVCEIPYP